VSLAIALLGYGALGWFARAPWQAASMAMLVAAVLEIVSLIRVGGGLDFLWWLPLTLVAPTLWALAGFHLRRWLSRHGRSPEPGLAAMQMALGGVIGACLGAVGGYNLGRWYIEWAEVRVLTADAGYLEVFQFGLPGLLIGFILGLLLGLVRSYWTSSPSA
jgi:hypothetical protein